MKCKICGTEMCGTGTALICPNCENANSVRMILAAGQPLRTDNEQYLIDTLKDILVSCDSLEKLKWRVMETLKHFKTE